jgi:prepilin-type N-terminal cleavage/methylation domain-containing protein
MSAILCYYVLNSPIGGVSRMPRTPLAMRTVQMVGRAGLTLLEAMVALVILGLVAAGFLETYAGALRATSQSRIWAQALVYAEQGHELIKVEGIGMASSIEGKLGGGFARRIAVRPWQEGVVRATVQITLPDGSQFELDRLVAKP